MTREWDHYSDVLPLEWRWKNFPPAEIACRGTGKLKIDEGAMDALQRLRDELGAPMLLNSAYRSPEHNRAVRGAKASQHLLARAFDVSMANHDPGEFEETARRCGFTGFGHYPHSNFMHIDVGVGPHRPARWKGKGKNNAWFAPSPKFKPEPKPAGVKEATIDAGKVLTGGAAVELALREASPYLPGEWGGYAILAAVALGVALVVYRLATRGSAEPSP